MARYRSILQKMKIEEAIIDYLYIDIGGNALDFFEDVFSNYPNVLKRVKMISIEIYIESRYNKSCSWPQKSICMCGLCVYEQ